jgi:pimeloyl-ACP methyl ester carboxylesterase
LSAAESPFNGETLKASHRRYEETVVFVHHFGGSKKTVLRHARLMNELGFDAFVFDLKINDFKSIQPPLTAYFQFGVRFIWADQIEEVLNSVPGKKIVYSFSMPSNSTLMAMSRRHAFDITSWVCDGGPFLDLVRCTWNLFTNAYPIKWVPLRFAASLFGYFYFGGLQAAREIGPMLDSLPNQFPILSIRGTDDPLVPVSAIDEVFSHGKQRLGLETFTIEGGHHLDGLKNHSDLYRSRVSGFIRAHSTIRRDGQGS